MSKQKLPPFYSLDDILRKSPRAKYYIIFSERSNGKTHAVLEMSLKEYLSEGHQLGLIRRYEEDFLLGNAEEMMKTLTKNKYRGNIVETLTKGKYNDFEWKERKFTLIHRNSEGLIDLKDTKPFCHTFYLMGAEHKKSVSYPEIKNVLFDEFLTNDRYLINETKKFFSLVSTIVRLEDDVRFFLCGNTVSQYSPYFGDFGIDRVRQMKKGTIDVYRYGDSGLEVAVEYAEFPETVKDGKRFKKKSDVYFAFENNPNLKMITEGEWETNLYPHLPTDYHFWNVVYRFYIIFEKDNFECEVIVPPKDESTNLPFVFIHRKTTPVKDEENFKAGYYCFKQDYDNRPLMSRDILHPRNQVEQKILSFFKEDRVFYQDNLLGESIRRFFEWCGQQ